MAYTPNEWACGDVIAANKLNSIERGIAEVNGEYVPTEWECGDVITADRMNHIEQGIANAGGGSSDFSMAEVAWNVEEGKSATLYDLFYIILSNDGTRHILQYKDETLNPQNGAVITVPLLDGYTNFGIEPSAGSSISVSGDCEYSADSGGIEITGDCTITIS